MCIYAVKKQKLKKYEKILRGRGVRNSTGRPKIRGLRRKGYG